MLLATLTDLLTLCPSATVYLSFKKRRRADARFFKEARKTFCVAEIKDDEDRPAYTREGLFLYTITSKK